MTKKANKKLDSSLAHWYVCYNNQIYLESIASDIFTLNSVQQNALLAVASQCPKLGGDAVLQARELYSRLVAQTIFDDGVLCSLGARVSGTERTIFVVESNYKAVLVPNPSQDHFILHVSGLSENLPLAVKIFDLNGRGVKELSVQNGEIFTHALVPGLYFCHIYVGVELADIVKLVVIR